MEYIDMCKYIFNEEKIDWELHNSKSRKKELVEARYISIYLGNYFYPKLKQRDLGIVFDKCREDAWHAIKQIGSLLITDKELKAKVDKYIMYISIEIQIHNINTTLVETSKNKLLDVLDKMEEVVKLYCKLTNTKLIKNE